MARAFSLLAMVAAVCSACSQTSALGGTLTASRVLASAQQAVDRAGSFRITVQGHNFVLPQWGGIDGGTVTVTHGGDVTAQLDRTGDGLYSMIFVNKQTFFERSTCSHWTRVPGGGATVLVPFLWSTADVLGSASPALIVSQTGTVVVVDTTIAALGPGTATITIARATSLPMKATWTSSDYSDNGSHLSWSFSDWGTTATVRPPGGSPSDNGPGGNPC